MNLKAMAFRKPDLTAEEWEERNRQAEEYEAAEMLRVQQRMIAESGVPIEYRNADLSQCVDEVKQYADDPGNLIIRGKVGRGKTYSAAAIIVALSKRHLCCFVPASLLTTWANPYNAQGAEKVSQCKGTALLVIDDLGKETPDKHTVRVLWEIINHRLYNDKPTVITTQYVEGLAKRLSETGELENAKAIISRLSLYQTLDLTGNDRRKGGGQ